MAAIQGVAQGNVVSWKVIWRMLVGAIVGAGLGYGSIKLAGHLHVAVKGMRWSDALGWWLGVTFFAVGLVFFVMSFNRRELAKSLEGYSAKLPATNEEVRSFRLQSATLVLAGVMLLIPFMAQGTVHSATAGWILFVAIVVLFGVQTVANVALWRNGDEFLRQQMLITGAVSFAIVQAALFLWAAAEHLHLVRPISSWDAVTLLLLIYLCVVTYLAIRNRPTFELVPD